VNAASPKAWANFSMDQYQAYLSKIGSDPGGFHVDVFGGQFSRREGTTFSQAWRPVAQTARNMVLYDGQNQWHRTYGPSYTSFSFGKNHYLNLNSFDLRQHRRTGWGMYTVNYGGGMSKAQESWLERQVGRVEADKANAQDIVLLAHHDPRGGHHGLDYPYLFPQVDYKGLPEVVRNFVIGEVINPKLCAIVPAFAQSDEFQLSCIHDGLQEWMLADPEFDCADGDRKPDGMCDVTAIQASAQKSLYFSNLALINFIATHPSIRTLLLGHTHYNELAVLQSGDELIPQKDSTDNDKVAGLNVNNPVRAFSFFAKLTGRSDFDPSAMEPQPVWSDSDVGVQLHQKAIPTATRTLQGAGRELVVLRLTSNADITSQKFCSSPGNCKTMLGFSTFSVSKKAFQLPQINDVTFFLNDGGGSFETVKSVSIPRTSKVARDGSNNPVAPLFSR
jgi:hypothetical protein